MGPAHTGQNYAGDEGEGAEARKPLRASRSFWGVCRSLTACDDGEADNGGDVTAGEQRR